MKLEKLFCPYCGANLNFEISNRETIFCPYCGQQIHINFEKNEFTLTKNININKRISKKERKETVVTDKTEVARYRAIVISIIISFLLMGILFLDSGDGFETIKEEYNLYKGRICAGDYSDYTGTNYKTAEDRLRVIGFTDITLIDLDDAGTKPAQGWFDSDVTTVDGEVEDVSNNGKTHFHESDYFEPDAKIFITYH